MNEGNGASYRGNVSVTETGLTCQRWDSHTPHSHSNTPENHPSSGLEQNYCRNPDEDPAGVWCFTTDPDTTWDYCDVPECETCQEGNGASYRGNVSVTETGLTCQRWDSHTPHWHINTPENFPSSGLEQNYCRNPDGDLGVWCYTTDPNSRYEYCDVPVCDSVQGPCQEGNGASYRGAVSVTVTGLTCQRWNSQTPHEHTITPENHPSSGLEQNYCRNPDDDSGGVWCFTTDPDTIWEYCDVPVCDSVYLPGICQEGNGASYRGNVSVTVTGSTCQRWDSQTPHEHNRTPGNHPSSGLEQNYCRNPDDWFDGVWCYTTDPERRWDYCDVPVCETCQVDNGLSYRGTVSVTESGLTCQRWDSSEQPHTPEHYPSSGLEENYCRNPDEDSGGVWCYTTDPDRGWDYCDVPVCVNCQEGEMASYRYRGTVSVTGTGLTCQRWDSGEHGYTPENYPTAGLEQNYCRNPGHDAGGVWCFTTDPDTTWDYCDVPLCGNEDSPTLEAVPGV
ncbi:plasminogen-like [Branchiostoma floridae x Branchiostoma belcheri]